MLRAVLLLVAVSVLGGCAAPSYTAMVHPLRGDTADMPVSLGDVRSIRWRQ